MTSRAGLSLILLGMGATWGLTQPLTKIAVSTGLKPFGLIFWELVLMALVLTGWQVLRGRPTGLSLRHFRLYLAIAVLGTLFPNYISFRSAVLLPAGVMSIIIAVVPIFSVPVALVLGNEKPSVVRFSGVLTGAVAVAMLLGPGAKMPAGVDALWLLVACLAPLSYACEGNFLARNGQEGLDAVQIILGSTLVGIVLALPLMLVSGQGFSILRPWDAAIWALVGSTLAHVLAYGGYVWIIGQAGAVFAAQVAYLVTATGMVWSMAILGESYAPVVWASFALMMLGITLVRPAPPPDREQAQA